MRSPFGWTLTTRAPLRILFACCASWGLPAVALAAAPEEPSIEKRVLALLVLACALGLIAGQRDRRSRGTHVRLHTKPKKIRPTILVPSGPVPPLIPGDSPKAARRAESTAPVLRQTPDGIPSSGLIDYIAPFSDSGEGSEATRVDYLLEAGETEVVDLLGDADSS